MASIFGIWGLLGRRQIENPPESVLDFGSRFIVSVVPINELKELFKPSTFCQYNNQSEGV